MCVTHFYKPNHIHEINNQITWTQPTSHQSASKLNIKLNKHAANEIKCFIY